MKIQYAVLDEDADAETKFDTTTIWYPEKEHHWSAEDCAKDYVTRCAGFWMIGWDDGQSKTFALFSEDGESLGVYEVTMEMVPTYQAALKEE